MPRTPPHLIDELITFLAQSIPQFVVSTANFYESKPILPIIMLSLAAVTSHNRRLLALETQGDDIAADAIDASVDFLPEADIRDDDVRAIRRMSTDFH